MRMFVWPKISENLVSQTIPDKIYGKNAQYQQKNQHHKRKKTTAYDLSSRSKSFGLVFRTWQRLKT